MLGNGYIRFEHADDAVDDIDKLARAVDADDFDFNDVRKRVGRTRGFAVDECAHCVVDDGCDDVVVRLLTRKRERMEDDRRAFFLAGRADFVVICAHDQRDVVACVGKQIAEVIDFGRAVVYARRAVVHFVDAHEIFGVQLDRLSVDDEASVFVELSNHVEVAV